MHRAGSVGAGSALLSRVKLLETLLALHRWYFLMIFDPA